MVAETLSTEALEDSTFVVTVAFTNEDEETVTPQTIEWSLKNEGGAVVNSRSAESETPANSIDILLSGDDLDPGTATVGRLLLTVTATYNSSLGNDLPLMGQCWIDVEALEP